MRSLLKSGGSQVEEGYRYGSIAMSMLKSNNVAPTWFGRVAPAFNGCVCPWKISHDQFLDPLKQAYRASLGSGDIEYAMLNASLVYWNSIEITPLPVFERQVRVLVNQMDLFGQTGARTMIEPFWQYALNLMGEAENPKVLTGEVLNQEEAIASAKAYSNDALLLWLTVHQSVLAYWVDDYDTADLHLVGLPTILSQGFGGVEMAAILFFETMILLAQVRRRGKWRRMSKVQRQLRTLRKWALHSPSGMLGKQFLIEGELAALQQKNLLAVSKYTSAIVHSGAEKNLADEALANERLGKFYLEQGDRISAASHLQNACLLYDKWGAKIRVNILRREIAQL